MRAGCEMQSENIVQVMLVYSVMVALIGLLTAAASSLVWRHMRPGKLKTALLIVRTPQAAILAVIAIYLAMFVGLGLLG